MRRLFGSESKLRNALTVLLALTMLVGAFAVASSFVAGASLAPTVAKDTHAAPAPTAAFTAPQPAGTYDINFTESGITETVPTTWSVTLTNSTGPLTLTSGLGSDQINFTGELPTPTTPDTFSVAAIAGYAITPTSGDVLVGKSNQSVQISFVQWHTIAFTETGLTAGQVWSVYVDESAASLGNDSPLGITWTENNTFNGTAPYGNYTYVIDPVPGFDVLSVTPTLTSDCGFSATTSWCNVTQVNDTVAIVFHASPQYTVQFNETGLATSGLLWSVTFAGATIWSTTSTVTFGTQNGTFAYSIGGGGTATGVNESTPSSGTITAPGYPCPGPNGGNLSGCTEAGSPFTTFQNISFAPAIGVSVSYAVGEFTTNNLPYFALPYNITWTTSVTNSVLSAGNLTQTLQVLWIQSVPAPGCGPFTYPCPVVFSVTVPFDEAAGGTGASGTFSYQITAADLTSSAYLGYGLPQGQWQFEVTATEVNASSAPLCWPAASPSPCAANIASGSGSTIQAAFMSIVPPNGQITAPANGSSVASGIITIAGNYSGYFVVSANVTVTNASGGTVLTASVFAPLVTTNPFAVTWHETVAGAYKIVLTLVAAWHLPTFINSTVTVSTSVGITYLNSTGLNIAGLGPGGSATLLVLIGLIIGMIVMALVGRSLWGGTKPGPAQPWTGQGSKPADDTMGGSGGMGSSGGGMSGGSSGSGGMSGGSGGMSGGGTSGGGMGGNPPS
jgi:hypothetical protein